MSKPLPKRQRVILRLLSRGWTYQRIQQYLGIKLETVHSHCGQIRQRTGITNTRDAAMCKKYMDGIVDNEAASLPVTSTQLMVLRFLAKGQTYADIADTMGTTPQTVQNHATIGCRRAGIKRGQNTRAQEIRSYLARLDGTSTADPMDDPMFN